MRKTFTSILLALSAVMYAKDDVTKILSVPVFQKKDKAEASVSASYKLPVVLANIGTISAEDNAVCNYLFPNDGINGGAYILASGDKPVSFVDDSSGSPSSWRWDAPGTAEGISEMKNLEAHYIEEGVFSLPSLTVMTSSGSSTYSPELKIKSGGKSEITTIDTREYGETYQFGAFAYGNEGGFVGGTNNVGIVGWGNLFMFGTDDVCMEGVNIYLHHKPERHASDAKLLVQVWYPAITEDEVVFRSLPLEAEYVSMADIKDASDGAWIPVKDGAVASVEFDTPLDLYGKTMIFISVEGFGSDPAKEDFCMLTDVKGVSLDEMEISNRLAHNSFGRLGTEDDYLRPISYYGGGLGSFAICPVLRSRNAAHVRGVVEGHDRTFRAAFVDGVLNVESDVKGIVRVFDLSGRIVCAVDVPVGCSRVPVNVRKGIWLVQGPDGHSLKISK